MALIKCPLRVFCWLQSQHACSNLLFERSGILCDRVFGGPVIDLARQGIGESLLEASEGLERFRCVPRGTNLRFRSITCCGRCGLRLRGTCSRHSQTEVVEDATAVASH